MTDKVPIPNTLPFRTSTGQWHQLMSDGSCLCGRVSDADAASAQTAFDAHKPEGAITP